ncbi:MAG: sodium:solute symporter family protein [Acidobacteriota bacterium]|nr:MAG: sodium:solute symporter family protein [Acidobacteriota bacterium]
MYGLAFWSRRRIHDEVDFLVAGRRLPLMLSASTLLATWFGAGTMLTATDEVRRVGLSATALEPLGSGFCLLIAGFFFAAPLWKMKLLTLSDFFGRRFGSSAEMTSACILVPSYFGWIAVQFLALAAMLELIFGLPLHYGVVVIAVVGTGYTLLGGMWSVTLTDAVQIAILLVGIVILGFSALVNIGDGSLLAGWNALLTETTPGFLTFIPTDRWTSLLDWFGVFCIAALGNVPTQDLTQRIFAAKSATVARQACWIAGICYIVFGLIPVILGLVSRILFPEATDQAILPLLARAFLTPGMSILFILALSAAVLSTIDSAILAPASVLGQNILPQLLRRRYSTLFLTRISIVGVSAASVVTAFLGHNAYSLLEEAYALTLVGLLVPLTLGIYSASKGQGSAMASMIVGCASWGLHFVFSWEAFLEPLLEPYGILLPPALSSALLGLLAYQAFPTRESSEARSSETGLA